MPVWYENLSRVVSFPENSNINTDGLDSVVIGSRDQWRQIAWMQLIISTCRSMLFDENNHFLTEIEAGSTEKILVGLIRFSVYENDAAWRH